MSQSRPTEAGAARHAILQVRWGPLSWHKAALPPGGVLRVGRAASAGLAVPQDAQLAEAHFEISWSGRRGWVKDLGTPTGVLLEGQRVEQGEVFHGSWLRAGQTDFSVFFERTTPPPEPEAPEPPELAAHKARALEALRGQKAPLYAIVDAARDERVLTLLRESVEECRSLYEGPQGETLSEVAPYLVGLPRRDSWLLEALVQEGWGAHWGVFLTCPLPLLELRRHLRRFLMVEADNMEGRLYFRFYDPRVLGAFLPTCLEQERKDFFGPIEGFLFNGPGGEVATALAQEAVASPGLKGTGS